MCIKSSSSLYTTAIYLCIRVCACVFLFVHVLMVILMQLICFSETSCLESSSCDTSLLWRTDGHRRTHKHTWANKRARVRFLSSQQPIIVNMTIDRRDNAAIIFLQIISFSLLRVFLVRKRLLTTQ